VAGGYKTDAGLHVFDWLDRDLKDSELDAIIYRDRTGNKTMETIQEYNNKVIVEFEPKTKAGDDTAKQVRLIIEDIYKAIGTDDRWGGLAIDTQPTNNEIDIKQSDKVMGSATLTIEIEYLTSKWSF
jgi:prolyl-tRNA editing enzyme YbaK/EbsC (Cys-tRNA(Pro) deacylase)